MRKGRSCPACRSSLLECGCRSEVSRVLRRCRASPFPCRTSSRSSQSERSINAFMRCASACFRSHFVWRCAIGLLSGIDVRADGESALRRGARLLGNHPVRDLCKGAVWLRGLVIRWQGGALPRRDQLTTVRSIEAFIEGTPGLNGVKKARSALRLTLERSRSPMETASAMLLSAPFFAVDSDCRSPFSIAGWIFPSGCVRESVREKQALGGSCPTLNAIWRFSIAAVAFTSIITESGPTKENPTSIMTPCAPMLSASLGWRIIS